MPRTKGSKNRPKTNITNPFLPDASGDGRLPRHEPQAGRLDGSGDRAAEKPLLQRLTGHRGSGAGR